MTMKKQGAGERISGLALVEPGLEPPSDRDRTLNALPRNPGALTVPELCRAKRFATDTSWCYTEEKW